MSQRIHVRDDQFSGKADEVEFLEKIAKVVPENSYLASMFTHKFIAWAEGEIKNDFPPDPIMWMDNARNYIQVKSSRDALQVDLEDLRGVHKELKEAHAETLLDLEKAQLEVQSLTVKLEYERSTKTAVRDHLDEVLDQNKELKAELVNQADQIEDAIRKFEIDRIKILELKAELYEAMKTIQNLEAGGSFPIDTTSETYCEKCDCNPCDCER